MQSKIVFLFVLSSHLLACRPPGRYVTDATPDTSSDDVSDVIVADRTDALLSNDATDVISAETTVEIATMEAAIDVAPDVIEMDASADTMEVGVDAMPDNGCTPVEAGVCPPLECRTPARIAATISTPTTLDCRTLWLMTGPVVVTNNTVLTVEAGTVVHASYNAGLLVTAGSRLVAVGTETDPIVFAKNPSEFGPPAPWGGIFLLGNARWNLGASRPYTAAQLGSTALSGWNAGGMNDDSNCGTLRYVRIERAGGQPFGTGGNLDALLLAACGRTTSIDYVQVHQSSDNAVRVVGGLVNLRHLVLSDFDADGLVWDGGWQGKGQFIAIRGKLFGRSDDGIQGDTRDGSGSVVTPASNPTLSNITLYGSRPSDTSVSSIGINLRSGTQGTIQNLLMVEQSGGGVDIEDELTMIAARMRQLTISNSTFFNMGASGTEYFPNTIRPPTTPNESDLFGLPSVMTTANVFGMDPGIPAQTRGSYAVLTPTTPMATINPAPMPSGDFFMPAPYRGALPPPGMGPDWMQSWTSFRVIP